MSKRAREQAARRAAREILNERHRQQAERERRLEQAAIRVLVALRERDEVVAKCERRAGEAIREMTHAEELSIREVVTWFGDRLTIAEATRLRRLVVADPGQSEEMRSEVRVSPTA